MRERLAPFLSALVLLFSLVGQAVDFDSLSAEDKQKQLWDQVTKTKYGALPDLDDDAPGFLTITPRLANPRWLKETMTTKSELLPADRRKLKIFHTFGSVAACEWKSVGAHAYSGLFKGALCVMRLSYAGAPALIGNIPGLGVKMLVKGKLSRDLLVMHSLNDQGRATSAFLNDFTNILPPIDPRSKGAIIMGRVKKHFEDVTEKGKGTELSVKHLAAITAMGEEIVEKDRQVPWKLIFKPVPNAKIDRRSTNDFRTDLAKVDSGTLLYQIYAQATPRAEAKLIGELRNTSAFVASSFGDQELFFRHESDFLRK